MILLNTKVFICGEIDGIWQCWSNSGLVCFIFESKMFPLRTNFALCVCGPTKAGKTTFVETLLNNSDRMFDKPFLKIHWILGDSNAIPKSLKLPVEFHIGMPSAFENDTNGNVLYILDDNMTSVTKDSNVLNLLTTHSHHKNISVIIFLHNFFHNSRFSRSQSLQYSYIAILNSPRDRQQFNFLARQIYPNNPKELVRIYNEITEKPYSYLFIDLTQTTHNLFRFRTDIFNPAYSTVYCQYPLPNEINGELVCNENCTEGSAFSAGFEEMQM